MPFGVGYGQGNKNPLAGLLGGFGGGQQQPPPAPTYGPGASMVPATAAPPGPEDFFGLKGQSSKSYAANIGAAGLAGIYGFGPQAQQQGFTTLLDILGAQGQTDPRLFNQQLASSSLNTQAQQGDLQAQLARMGLSGSGVGQAVGASIGQAGANQRADLQAREAQLQELRKREDLNLLLNLILNPGLSALTGRINMPSENSGPSTFESLLGAGTQLGASALMPGK